MEVCSDLRLRHLQYFQYWEIKQGRGKKVIIFIKPVHLEKYQCACLCMNIPGCFFFLFLVQFVLLLGHSSAFILAIHSSHVCTLVMETSLWWHCARSLQKAVKAIACVVLLQLRESPYPWIFAVHLFSAQSFCDTDWSIYRKYYGKGQK